MKVVLTSLLLAGHFMIVNVSFANQAIESVDAHSKHSDAEQSASQKIDSDDVEQVSISDAISASQQILSPDGADSPPATDNAIESRNTPRSDIPSVGYVPDTAIEDGGFDLVAGSSSRWDDVYVSAMDHERGKKHGLALIRIEELLAQRPEHSNALLARGRLLVKTQQYVQAKSSLLAITNSRTDDWRPWFWLGTAHLMLDELTAAEGAFDEALSRNGDIVETWLHRALVEQQRSNWRVALQLLSIADEVSPNHPLVMLNAAMCREALGYTDEAAAGYRKFLARSHRASGSKLLRFEVINHLSQEKLAEPMQQVEKPTTTPLREKYVEDLDVVDYAIGEYPPANMP